MATTKIWPVRDNLARVLEYAENHLKTANPNAYTAAELKDLRNVLHYAANSEKTAKQNLVTGVNCVDKLSYRQMTETKQRFGKSDRNLAYHAYQSFAPNEVTPELCHQIGVELAQRAWGDKYEVVISTHLNTKCIHNHFVINSVSFVDGSKFDNDYAMYFKVLRAESDRLCAEYGLSVIENPGRSGNRFMQQAEKRGEPTIWNVIRSDIDEAIRQTMTDRQFYWKMKQWGYTFDFNPNRKYPTIRPPGAKKMVRFKTLGENYTPDNIMRRILAHGRPYIPPPSKPRVQQRYHYKGSIHNMRHIGGLCALFLIFTLLLRKIINRNRMPNYPQHRFTPEMREAIRRMERYSQQTRLLWRHKIETPEQLQSFIDSRNRQQKELEYQRGKVYNKMKSAKTPEKLAELKTERDKLSVEIKVIRRELFLAGGVQKEHAEIRRKIQAQRELDARQRKMEKSKIQNKNRGYSR